MPKLEKELSTTPSLAQEPSTVTQTVRDPDTGKLVTDESTLKSEEEK